MTYIKTNQKLNEKVSESLKNLTVFIENNEKILNIPSKELFTIDNLNDESLEFTSWWKYTIRKEFYPWDGRGGIAIIKTYEIITDINDTAKRKLNHIKELDIIFDPLGNMTYLIPIEIQRERGLEKVSIFSNFPNNYLSAFLEVIQKYKNLSMPNIGL